MIAAPLDRLRGVRIAHLIETDGPGGAERTVVNIATGLQAAGSENLVILPANAEGWLARELSGTGVAIEYFRLERPVSPACARWLTSTLRRYGTAIAHSHEFSMAVYGGWAAWRAGIPHVITMHGSRYYAGRLQRRLAMRIAVAASGNLVAVSKQLATHLSADLGIRPSRVTVVANGVRSQPVSDSSLRAELGLARDQRLLLAVGNLYPVKGHRVLLTALALLRDRHPAVHVALAGRGELADELQALARQEGFAERVHFLGLRSDIPNLLAAADIFVMPSLSEGLPLALLEAMFAGCPIVATSVGEVPTALGEGDAGLLVKTGDPVALAAALDRLLSDPREAQRLGQNAASRAAALYNISHMVAHYARIYGGLLPEGWAPAPSDPTGVNMGPRRPASSR
jgi:glycosyltransferase involved in cell wall biosynthesis